MTTDKSILEHLGLTLRHVSDLRGRRRDALLHFLLRWEHYQEALACLEALLAQYPDLVGLLDQRARALQGLRRHAEALETMRRRHALEISVSSRILEGEILLASGDHETAQQVAQELMRTASHSLYVLSFAAEVHLARGEYTEAQAAYRQVNELTPDSRSYWVGMLMLHQALGDQVTASGYAVRLERSVASLEFLPVPMLRRLRDYYRSSAEINRADDMQAVLLALYAKELATLEVTFGDLAEIARHGQELTAEQAQVQADKAGLPPAQMIPVSPEEQARITQAARELFGHERLMPGQLETLAAALRGQDVLTILRTGGGKSLCYQLPAFLAEQGVTLVISPLIALMKDQVEGLPTALRSQATTINSALEGDELRQSLQRLAQGRLRLVYAAPERLRQVPFLHALRRAGVVRLVIDEAHCVSMWGHDFRPDYLYIGRARELLGRPPVLAMTATAPPRVRRDILQRLGMRDAAVVTGESLRPNLYLGALHLRKQDDKLRQLLTLCKREAGSGIVYVSSRARAEELAHLLEQQRIAAGYYHAGIGDREQRNAAQDTFMSGEVRVMVATVAFGMGIDKADIRFIIHYDPPSSLEAYYQEAGRAGRDGQEAHCLLLYTSADRGTLTLRAHRDQLKVETLRAVYAAVKRRLGKAQLGHLPLGDLARDVQAEETPVRVALSLLEEAGLLRRHQDWPRTAVVQWRPLAAPPAELPQTFTAFLEAARLKGGESLGLDLLPIAQAAGLDPLQIEEQVLAWTDTGWLYYRSAGHDLLLELLPAPSEATTQVQELLDRYASIQVQRVDEILAYAHTPRCRHGHISAYLSGQPAERCRSCDNCRPDVAQALVVTPADASDLPAEREQLQIILSSLADHWGWGRRNLLRILRGDREASEQGQSSPAYGRLAFRSGTAIGELLDRLLTEGLLSTRILEHGGLVIEITSAGQAALKNPRLLDPLLSVVPSPTVSVAEGPASQPEEDVPDQVLLERLRAWRIEKAHAANLPLYCITQDAVLHAIATLRPRNATQLDQIRGIGPRKVAKYGAEILEIVARSSKPN